MVVLDNASGEVLAWVGSAGAALSSAHEVDAVLARAVRQRSFEFDLLADHAGSGAALGRRWSAGLARWAPRAERLDPARDLVALHRLGGGLLIPEDDAWPAALDDLGQAHEGRHTRERERSERAAGVAQLAPDAEERRAPDIR